MERENKKRGRDQGEEKKEPICKLKKQELSYVDDLEIFREINGGRLCNEFAVFDFPWLKDGLIFNGDEGFNLEDTFAPSYLNVDQFFVENSCQPRVFSKFDDEKFEDNLRNFQFDDLDPLDSSNWSSVFDQPLDITINKV